MSDFDILVVGGGPAGATAAALLASGERRVALLDPRRPPAATEDLDPRVVAVSPGSRRIVEAARAWRRLDAGRVAPYDTMAVLDGRAEVTFRAAEHGLERLGWILELPALQRALWEQLEQAGDVAMLTGTGVTGLDDLDGGLRVTLADGRHLDCRLVVAADGARSPLRHLAGIETRCWHYNQHTLCSHLTTAVANPGCAWQRYTDDGPLGLLPLSDGRSSLVWSLPDARARELAELPETELAAVIDAESGRPFGAVMAMTRRLRFPLVRRRAETLAGERLALVGDAARTVHPMAGLGMNLGLADAAALAEVLAGWTPADDPAAALARYARWRAGAGETVATAIHVLNELETGGWPVPAPLRRLGMQTVGRVWPLRELMVRRACGLDADSPLAART